MTIQRFQTLIDLYHKGELAPVEWTELRLMLKSGNQVCAYS